MNLVVVALLFYLGWFGSVFMARMNLSAWSLVFPLILFGFLLYKKELNLKSAVFALILSVVGVFFDFLFIQFGFISTIGESIVLVPIWLIAIWFLFSFSMIVIAPKINLPVWAAALIGALMGPLSYKSGEIFGVLQFLSHFTFVLYSLFWGLMFPLILRFSKRLI